MTAGALPLEEQQRGCHRKLGCPTKTTTLGVLLSYQSVGDDRELLDRRDDVSGFLTGQCDCGIRQCSDKRSGALQNLLALLRPSCGHRLDHLGQGGLAPAGLWRQIGLGIKRSTLGCGENGQWPPQVVGEGLSLRHIEGIHFGVFLSVHFDADQFLVQQFGGGLVIKALPRHHVTPVAGGVANGDHHRAVPTCGLGESFGPPGEPVHALVGVGEQIRT